MLVVLWGTVMDFMLGVMEQKKYSLQTIVLKLFTVGRGAQVQLLDGQQLVTNSSLGSHGWCIFNVSQTISHGEEDLIGTLMCVVQVILIQVTTGLTLSLTQHMLEI